MEALSSSSVITMSPEKSKASDRCLPSSDEGFDDLVREHQQRIFRVLVGWTGDEASADNLTQETFLRAFLARESFRGDSAVSTWLYRIAIRVAQDHDKNRRVGFWRRLVPWGKVPWSEDASADPSQRMESSIESSAATPEQELLARERLHGVRAVVERLPAGQRAVFQLRFIEEMSMAEIADILNLKIGTVKTQLHRAVHAVRDRLPAAGE